MCLESHFDIIGNWKLIVGHLDIYYAKKGIKFFVCVEVRFLVEKWIIYEAHIFRKSLVRTCRLETNSLCLITRLRVNKNFYNLIIFIEINLNVWYLCAHPVMTSITFILEDLTVNKNSVTHLVSMFQMISFFRILRSWKARISHRSFSPHIHVLKSLKCLEISDLVRNWKKPKNYFSWWRKFSYAKWNYQYSYTN